MPTSLYDITIPDTLSDFPAATVAAAIANGPLGTLDDGWHTPVNDIGGRLVRPDFDFGDHHKEFACWLEHGDNRAVFAAELEEALVAAMSALEEKMLPGRRLRLLATTRALSDPAPVLLAGGLAAAPADGTASPDEAWGSWSWGSVPAGMGELGGVFPGADANAPEWTVVADWAESDIDWSTTLLLFAGFGDFEREIAVAPGATPLAIVSSVSDDDAETANVPTAAPKKKRRQRVVLPAATVIDGDMLRGLFKLAVTPVLWRKVVTSHLHIEMWSVGTDACIDLFYYRDQSGHVVAVELNRETPEEYWLEHIDHDVNPTPNLPRNVFHMPKGTEVTGEAIQALLGLAEPPRLVGMKTKKDSTQVWATNQRRPCFPVCFEKNKISVWFADVSAAWFCDNNNIPLV